MAVEEIELRVILPVCKVILPENLALATKSAELE